MFTFEYSLLCNNRCSNYNLDADVVIFFLKDDDQTIILWLLSYIMTLTDVCTDSVFLTLMYFHRENNMHEKITFVKGKLEDVTLPIEKVRYFF